MFVRIAALSLVSLALSAGICAAQTAKPFSFGLWGDMPYKKAGDDPKLPAVLQSINQSDILFSLYDGDIKDGSSKCTDEVYTDALKMFNTLVKPVVYVPGDNEWTDCHRSNSGGFDALERLSLIRRTFFGKPESLGQTKVRLIQQGESGAKFSENTRFAHRGIVFVGLNVPGSNNNWVSNAQECTHKSVRTQLDCDAANAEYLERNKANIEWLKAAFAQARAQSARGVVVVIQANPGFDLSETWPLDESTLPEYSGYRQWMAALIAQTESFTGQVLLVHGDDHFFKIDKPLYSPNKMLKNFTRVQTFGSPSNHWVKVTVDVSTPQVFDIQPVIVEGN